MARRGASRRNYSRNYSYGRERALQHIEEAKQLTRELGGSDQDVKAYFFALSGTELKAVLDAYEARYGSQARQYAEETIPKWRSGRVTMSGMVGSRLFSLLPPRMPLAAKYRLTENLWRHVGPSSKRTLRIGLDADLEAVLDAARTHIDEVVTHYKIPDDLERRFSWLSAGDVGVKQQLLNHVRQLEKSLVVDGARAQLPVMLAHMSSADAAHTHRLAQVLKVGKHELELLVDKTASGVRLETWVQRQGVGVKPVSGDQPSWAWLWWLVGIGVLLWLFSQGG